MNPFLTFAGKDLSSDPQAAADPRPRSLAINRDPSTGSPFDALSPDDKAYAFRVLAMPENQGRSAQEIVDAINEQTRGAQPAPVEPPGIVQRGLQTITSGLQAARGAVRPAAQNLADFATHPLDRLSRPLESPETFRSGDRLGTGGRMLAEGLNPVPGSATEAAALVPLLAIPGAGRMRDVLRAGAAVASGAATGAAETGSPESGGLMGAVAGAAPLLGRLLRFARVKSGTWQTPGASRVASEAATPGIAAAIGAEVPALGSAMGGRSAESLLALRDPGVGLKALRTQFERSDRAIVSHFGDTPMRLPSLPGQPTQEALTLATRLGVPPTHPIVVQMLDRQGLPASAGTSAQEVLSQIKVLKETGRLAPDGATGFAARQQARAVESDLRAALPESLRTGYEAAVNAFDKGLDLLAVLRKSGAFTGDVKGPVVDVDRIRDFLVQHIEEYPPSRLPNLWNEVFQGIPGARDVIQKLGSERVYMGNVGVGLPGVTFRQRVGAKMPRQPNAPGLALGGAGLLRSFNPDAPTP